MTVGQTDGLEKQVEELEYENARLINEQHLRDAMDREEWQIDEFMWTTMFTLAYAAGVCAVLFFADIGVGVLTAHASIITVVGFKVGYLACKVILVLFGCIFWITNVTMIYHHEIKVLVVDTHTRFRKVLRALFLRG